MNAYLQSFDNEQKNANYITTALNKTFAHNLWSLAVDLQNAVNPTLNVSSSSLNSFFQKSSNQKLKRKEFIFVNLSFCQRQVPHHTNLLIEINY